MQTPKFEINFVQKLDLLKIYLFIMLIPSLFVVLNFILKPTLGVSFDAIEKIDPFFAIILTFLMFFFNLLCLTIFIKQKKSRLTFVLPVFVILENFLIILPLITFYIFGLDIFIESTSSFWLFIKIYDLLKFPFILFLFYKFWNK